MWTRIDVSTSGGIVGVQDAVTLWPDGRWARDNNKTGRSSGRIAQATMQSIQPAIAKAIEQAPIDALNPPESRVPGSLATTVRIYTPGSGSLPMRTITSESAGGPQDTVAAISAAIPPWSNVQPLQQNDSNAAFSWPVFLFGLGFGLGLGYLVFASKR